MSFTYFSATLIGKCAAAMLSAASRHACGSFKTPSLGLFDSEYSTLERKKVKGKTIVGGHLPLSFSYILLVGSILNEIIYDWLAGAEQYFGQESMVLMTEPGPACDESSEQLLTALTQYQALETPINLHH